MELTEQWQKETHRGEQHVDFLWTVFLSFFLFLLSFFLFCNFTADRAAFLSSTRALSH